MTDPATPTDQGDPIPAEEDDASTGAWMGERDPEPSASPEPPEA